jgi:imidazoleglycerol-phosphate dehydratase
MLDHLLEQIAQHGLIDITIAAKGDLHRDAHHTAEDVAICLGRALNDALGDRKGIVRMADALVPLDEALALVALDLNGRGYSSLDLSWSGELIGELPTDMVGHVLSSLAVEGRFTLHARIMSGGNDHHKAEALFKALARCLGTATRLDPRRAGQTPSTKGSLDLEPEQELCLPCRSAWNPGNRVCPRPLSGVWGGGLVPSSCLEGRAGRAGAPAQTGSSRDDRGWPECWSSVEGRSASTRCGHEPFSCALPARRRYPRWRRAASSGRPDGEALGSFTVGLR